ncbi:MAG: hypothetical protein ACT4NL_00740 [Pseudomarimonas sp.]
MPIKMRWFQVAFACVCAGYVLLAWSGSWLAAGSKNSSGSLYLALHVALSLLMLIAWVMTPGAAATYRLRWLLIAGILVRLALINVPPFTTHDIDRYLWDGAVAAAGFDPYRLPPDAPALSALRLSWPTPAEHSAYPTLYPPAALALYALIASAGPQFAPWLWKLAVTAASIGALLFGARLLAGLGKSRHLALLALSPLLVLESGIGAHLDVFSTLALLLALLAFQRGALRSTGVALGVGAALKLLPLLALLPLSVIAGRRALPMLAAAALSLALIYAGALAAGWHPLGSLPVFFERWRVGAPLFAGLSAVLAAVPRSAVLALLLVWMLTRASQLARDGHVARSLQWTLAAPLVVSPVLFPWYLSALVPLAALAPSASLLTALSLVPASYEVLDGFNAGSGWHPANWPLWLLAAGMAVAAWIDTRRAA